METGLEAILRVAVRRSVGRSVGRGEPGTPWTAGGNCFPTAGKMFGEVLERSKRTLTTAHCSRRGGTAPPLGKALAREKPNRRPQFGSQKRGFGPCARMGWGHGRPSHGEPPTTPPTHPPPGSYPDPRISRLARFGFCILIFPPFFFLVFLVLFFFSISPPGERKSER